MKKLLPLIAMLISCDAPTSVENIGMVTGVTHRVKTVVEGEGTISPSGTQTVERGDTLILTVETTNNHKLDSLVVDGSNKGVVSACTLFVSDTLHIAIAYFSKIPSITAGKKLIPSKGQYFLMGSESESSNSDESPVHKVSFTYDFYMDSTEVTQREYHDIMLNAHENYNAWAGISSYGSGDNYPTYKRSWHDAALYCNALSRNAGLDTVYSYESITGEVGNGGRLNSLESDLNKNGFRLPTEAEWEYACRAETTTDLYWGTDNADLYAWHAGNTESSQEVAQKRPNGFGLYDMVGNVSEWCQDWYDSSYYDAGDMIDPVGPVPQGWDNFKVVRGNDWRIDSEWYRVSNRNKYIPGAMWYFHGFRTVLPIKE